MEIIWCKCLEPKIKLTWGIGPFVCGNCRKPIKSIKRSVKKEDDRFDCVDDGVFFDK